MRFYGFQEKSRSVSSVPRLNNSGIAARDEAVEERGIFRLGAYVCHVDPTTARPRLVRMTRCQRTGWLVALGAHELPSSLQLKRGRLQRGLHGQELSAGVPMFKPFWENR